MEFDILQVPPQEGRVAVITGANTGLGLEVAQAFTRKHMTVILACRDLVKGNAARIRLQQRGAVSEIEVMQLDLASLASVRQFADDFLQRYARLDLLINNAGVMMPPYSLTEDGFESQLGINFLGHFLLTGLLLPRLESTPGSRTVSLASLAHKSGRIDFSDLQSKSRYNPWACYAQSKLACLMFAYEMQRRLSGRNYQTLSVAAHPGVSDSDLSRHLPGVARLLAPLFLKVAGQNSEQGAQPILYAALGSDILGGDYTGPARAGGWRGEPVKVGSSWRSQNREVAARLWRSAEELTAMRYLSD